MLSSRPVESCRQRQILVSAKNLLEGDRGFLKVGYQGSARVVLSPILDRFFKHYPNVQVSVEELGAPADPAFFFYRRSGPGHCLFPDP
ncbi:MAG: hypothetical protein V8R75_03495 [Oscillospiraceae bacterium]